MRIEPLSRHRGHIATLAAWHFAEWQHLYDAWTPEAARQELESHVADDDLPTTLLLLDDNDTPAGSVSLVLEDAPEFRDEGSPWLANLYVVPQARGRGLGAILVAAAVDLARHRGIERLFLFTPDQQAFYCKLGWRQLARTTLKGTAVDLMEFDFPADSAATGVGSGRQESALR